MIVNITNTIAILKKYDIKPKKKYGQNFLIDGNVLRRIITLSKVSEKDGIIEIGPGIGALTEALAEAAYRVLAYEIDEKFITVLNNELIKYKNLRIIEKDFLKANICEDISLWLEGCKRLVAISNLPYYITTPIIFKLLEEGKLINEFYLMVQKEVGTRLTATPGSKEYGALSVFMEYKATSEILFEVSKNCFYPKPEVESVVIAIKRKQPPIVVKSENDFLFFIRKIFSQKRKTLMNNIYGCYSINKEQIQSTLNKLNLRLDIRSENLDLQEIRDIYVNLFESPNQ
ncbi:MAG: 16S rRNA (adenine(1518)-N(6)/adenine(1519)-N(6))-dimethyltransferase RsmA [Bacilli bacterium]|nr:16S rRNA (adenine(1518)-N(6)/adenine(1519)-N(6))-dimethyltransferase RsmA [Bacilli bacterium]MDD4076933.1 16S rRNA (adenine(1518)-N(6)/adenine(1519)-N(6))-dimethyltransferase RsmA [Bacilli bacterium]MDD4388084.1 16S rRNA (adenine(1518)-N(6)/adenine(1519)-N(6))-dimethyltransferase RsmA [Bacilli bacterium]